MKWSTFAVVTAMAVWAPPAFAQAPDPAIQTITTFDDALLASMHHNTSGLSDAVDSDFNSNVMAAFIVGSSWTSMAGGDQRAVAAALGRYLVARFADEFDSYNGQHFEIDADVQARGPDKLVKTQVIQPNGPASHLDYRMRLYDGRWRIIDVYFDGVSQLATQHADVASVVAQGGATALVAHLDAATRALQ